MKTGVFILFCFLFISCTNYKIETISEFYYGQNGFDTLVPSRFKPYLTKTQIKEFEYGLDEWMKHNSRVFHSLNYIWINDSLFNGKRYKDTVVKKFEYFFYADISLGREVGYYPDGKISFEKNHILMNDSTGKTISIEDFNKLNKGISPTWGYYAFDDGSWKYYSSDGKLTKEEIYDKGTLKKTINY